MVIPGARNGSLLAQVVSNQHARDLVMRFTVELHRSIVVFQHATVTVEALCSEDVELNGWEREWGTWEDVDTTASTDEITMEIAETTVVSGEPDVDLTPAMAEPPFQPD